MVNFPLLLLFWFAVPTAIYRSRRRWWTFFVFVGTFLGTMLLVVIVGAFWISIAMPDEVSTAKLEELVNIAVDCGELVGSIACLWHSQRTRKEVSAAVSPVPDAAPPIV